MKIEFGTIIEAVYKEGSQKQGRQYKVIGVYPTYVLCRRDAPGGIYLKCFQKTDIINGTLPTEEYNL